MTTLRPYQVDATDAPFKYWQRGGRGSPLVVMATASGKSVVAASTCRRLVEQYDARVLVATHRKELIDQDANAIRRLWPEAPLGIYSAGLGMRRIDRITVAGVQSIWRKARELGRIDVMIVDEVHLVPPDSAGMYGELIKGLREINQDMRLLGYTATPYRLGQGLLTEGDGRMFDCVCYETNIIQLIADGYLSPLVSGKAHAQVDTSSVGTANGDFIARDLELAADLESVNAAVAQDVADALAAGRRAALVFSCGVAHAHNLRNALQMAGVRAEVVVGETPNRDAILRAYKAGELPCVVSCDVLTTGFDAPLTDVIAVVRPTQSTALHVQILGRGMRLSPGKTDCMVLDYGGNIARHGPITDVQVRTARKGKGKGVAPTRICPQCYAENNARASTCIECDTPLVTDEEKRANAEASALDPMVGASKPRTHDVGHISARVHVGKESGRTSLAVSFLDTAWQPIATEYVCLEHDGYAQQKAHRWWRAFVDDAPPATCEDGAAAIKAGRMRPVLTLTTKRDGKYKRIVSATFGESQAREPGQDDDAVPEEAPLADHVMPDDDIPF